MFPDFFPIDIEKRTKTRNSRSSSFRLCTTFGLTIIQRQPSVVKGQLERSFWQSKLLRTHIANVDT